MRQNGHGRRPRRQRTSERPRHVQLRPSGRCCSQLPNLITRPRRAWGPPRAGVRAPTPHEPPCQGGSWLCHPLPTRRHRHVPADFVVTPRDVCVQGHRALARGSAGQQLGPRAWRQAGVASVGAKVRGHPGGDVPAQGPVSQAQDVSRLRCVGAGAGLGGVGRGRVDGGVDGQGGWGGTCRKAWALARKFGAAPQSKLCSNVDGRQPATAWMGPGTSQPD